MAGWSKCCSLLIKSGANINYENHNKLTPLILVITSAAHKQPTNNNDIKDIWLSKSEMVNFLVENGANIQSKDFMGRSAVQLAAEKAISLNTNYRVITKKHENENENNKSSLLQEKSNKRRTSTVRKSHRQEYDKTKKTNEKMKNATSPPKEAKESAEKFLAWMERERLKS